MGYIAVAFSTKVRPGIEIDESQIQAPSNYRNKEAIDGYRTRMRDKMIAEAGSSTFSCEFDRVLAFKGGKGVEISGAETCKIQSLLMMDPDSDEVSLLCLNPSLLRHLLIMDVIQNGVGLGAKPLLFPSHWDSPNPHAVSGAKVVKFYDPVYLISGQSVWDSKVAMIDNLIPGFAPGTPESDLNSILSITSRIGLFT